MNAEILTTKSREVLQAAISAATAAGHATVEPAHLLAALLTTEGSTAPGLLRAVGADPNAIAAQVKALLARMPASSGATIANPSCRGPSPTCSPPPSRSCGPPATSSSPPSTCWPRWPRPAPTSAAS